METHGDFECWWVESLSQVGEGGAGVSGESGRGEEEGGGHAEGEVLVGRVLFGGWGRGRS